MFCTSTVSNTAFGNSDFKLEYVGVTLDHIYHAKRIVYSSPGHLISKTAGQHIAEHVWQSIKQTGQSSHVVYVKIKSIVNPNGSVFIALRVFISNVSQAFLNKHNILTVHMYAPSNLFIGTDPVQFRGANCTIPTDFQGRYPVQTLLKPSR